MLKPRSNGDDDGNEDKDKDTVIASVSKNHDDHNIVFFAPVVVVVAAADDGGTRQCGRLLTLTPVRISCRCARRRRGWDPLSSNPRSYNNDNNDGNDNDDKNSVIASTSKNNDDHNIVFFAVLAKPQSNNNNDNYNDDNNDKDAVIASASKNNDDQEVVFFLLFVVAVAAADIGVIRPCRFPLTLPLSRRRRGGDPLSSKPWIASDNKDNDALIASTSKNNQDHVW